MFYYLIFIIRLIITLSAGIFLEDMFVAVVSLVPRSVAISFSLPLVPKTHSTYRRDALAGTQTIVCYQCLSATNENEKTENKIGIEHQSDVVATTLTIFSLSNPAKISECVSVPTLLSYLLLLHTYRWNHCMVLSTDCTIATRLSVEMSFFRFFFTYCFVDVLTLRFRLLISRLFLFLFTWCSRKFTFGVPTVAVHNFFLFSTNVSCTNGQM